jgi:UTP-glucose-1-phosphate uridylyltransferase
LNELKLKLKKLEERQPPKDKDELIDHLMERLEQAEQAIFAAEEVITHERKNRKLISSELKAKNMELRKLVEKEKRSLQDKVHDQLEVTL